MTRGVFPGYNEHRKGHSNKGGKRLKIRLWAAVVLLLCLTAGALAEEETILFGAYPQSAEGTDRTPIEWLVLERDPENHRALLLSRYGLDAMPFHREYKSVTWEDCDLRAWLNGAFLETAFSAQEREKILTAEVDNGSAQGYGSRGADGGNPTWDQLFLLSYAEAKRYLGAVPDGGKSDASRAAPTGYAVSRGAYTGQTEDGGAAGYWWLRTPGYYHVIAAAVGPAGAVLLRSVRNGFVSVRPAMWVRTEDGSGKT